MENLKAKPDCHHKQSANNWRDSCSYEGWNVGAHLEKSKTLSTVENEECKIEHFATFFSEVLEVLY